MKKTIKRNNIKVPAYTPGGTTPGVSGSAAGNGLTAAQVGAIGQGAITAGGMLANSFLGTSTATTSSQVAAQTAGDIFGGIGKGASIGAAFGPWGAAIGGAIGGVVGSIGQKGREAGMTSFTDYDQGTLGTGLMGAFGANRRLRRERNRIKSNAYANRAAVEGTENLAYEFAQENTMGGVNSFKDGGMMGNKQLAFTDRGEVMLHPDGTVTQNPDAGTHGADQYLSALEPGTAVLGNKINPRTGNKFKEDGDAVTKKYKTRKSLQNIQFADSKMLNDRNMVAELQRLVDEQQAVLDKEGNKKKFKKLDGSKVMAAKDGIVIPAYEGGVKNFYSLSSEEQQKVRESDPTYKLINWIKNKIKKMPSIKKDYTSKPNVIKQLSEEYINSGLYDPNMEQVPGYDIQKTIENFFYNTAKIPTNNEAFVLANDANADNKSASSEILQQQGSTKISPEFRNMILGRNEKPIIGGYHSFDELGLFNGYGPMSDASVEVPVEKTQMPIVAANVKANTKPTITEEELAANKKAAERPEVKVLTEAQHNMILNGLQQGLKTPDLYIPTGINNEPLKKMNIASPQKEPEKAPKDYSWIGDLAGTIGQLAAAIPGLGAKPEIEDAVYNPYHRTVMNSMRNRRAKLVEGAMADNARERAMSNYNLTRTGANTGRNLAAMTQSAVNAADAIAKVRLQEDNVNNQYRGEEAEMLNNLGQQWVSATNLARTNNAQNKAAALMTNDAARKSIHNILAGSTKSYNTKLRDKQLLPLYRRFLEAGFTHEDLAPLYS